MGFVIKSAAVIGLIYLASPLRPPMPDWLAHPAIVSGSPAAIAALKSQETTAPRATTPSVISKGPETISVAALKATMETAGRAVATACTGHEKSCLELAARAAKAATDTDPLAALIGPEIAHAASGNDTARAQNLVAEATPAPTIPLPPRREPDTQKKI
jgi:hypothetical protein